MSFGGSDHFTVLFVCTGNVCRSPLAERLFAEQVQNLPVAVHSAGTQALVGRGIDGHSAKALAEFGVDPEGHVAQRYTAQMINRADLILTAESMHRSVIVQAEPLTFRRAFTIVEFGRLGRELPALEDVTRDSLKARVKEIAGRRGWVDAPGEGADEIADPFGDGEIAAQRTAAAVAEAIAEVSSALGLFPVRV
jgi:protein-tyrosine phosphatase